MDVGPLPCNFITERVCVYWNTTTGNWSEVGLESVRKNLTQVTCASSRDDLCGIVGHDRLLVLHVLISRRVLHGGL